MIAISTTLAARCSNSGQRAVQAIGLYLLAAMLLLSACEQNEPVWDTENSPANPPLYQITNADGEIEGWLLGTIHALPDGVDWRTANIETVIAEADLLLVEIADQHNRTANAETFQNLATTPGLPPLEARVPPRYRESLARIIERSDYSPQDFTSVETWAAAIMLSRVDTIGKPQNGVDRAVVADFEGRDVRGFETTASQLGIFDALSPDDQSDLLRETVAEYDTMRANPGWLMKAWLIGDIKVLEEAASTGILADPELREALLIGRNRNWVQQLDPLLKLSARPLVAVGAAHLVGPDGVPAMLEKRGYRIERVD